ncbi:Hemolysin, contains CBS domains [Ekhidna lutea]|uniref:Hemolysin, contains CBS domains n=1 Tax=Ekhidna lutea TaxID=447679 RepID=A0A239IFR0_EKHLU|nr:hemolysin family protein [Ekhidna lutea]SNS92369.1 Hemolysin, contains CBS domains [Ekhidna lutea]
MDDPLPYLIILICLFFSAFFSGMEIAFVSADKLHIEVLKKKGTFAGRVLALFTGNQSQFLATMLVGNNIALVLYGIFMASLLEPVIASMLPAAFNSDVVVLIIQSIISTALVLLTAEFLPKSLFLINPDFSLRLFALPMGAIYVFMYPVVFLVVKISAIFIWMFGYRLSDEKPVFGLTDLNNYIKNNILNIKDEEEAEIDARIFNNAIEFKTIKVRECMIPRTEIVAVDVNDSIEELKRHFVESGHSKILVYKESIDEVIGYCHALELFKKPEDIKAILAEIPIVPETMLANELLIQFITDRKSLALVVDEYGGTSGLVSIEDVIEEIFGEIRDEHDDEYLTEQQLDEFNFIFSARHEIDYLNDRYELSLPEGEYDTLGGLIFAYHEDIPEVNEVIEIPPFVITIFTMEENRIDKVKLTLINKEELV